MTLNPQCRQLFRCTDKIRMECEKPVGHDGEHGWSESTIAQQKRSIIHTNFCRQQRVNRLIKNGIIIGVVK